MIATIYGATTFIHSSISVPLVNTRNEARTCSIKCAESSSTIWRRSAGVQSAARLISRCRTCTLAASTSCMAASCMSSNPKKAEYVMMTFSPIESAKVIRVIEIREVRGSGANNDPVRVATSYWSLDGKKLAERDPAHARSMPSACSNAKSESIK